MTETNTKTSAEPSRTTLADLLIATLVIGVLWYVFLHAIDWIDAATDKSNDTAGRTWSEVGPITEVDFSGAGASETSLIHSNGYDVRLQGHALAQTRPKPGESSYRAFLETHSTRAAHELARLEDDHTAHQAVCFFCSPSGGGPVCSGAA